ncbi:piwi-like protein 1 [Lineus longissimus]|uniref:piwi-like protein 1 n=1 Tax=Lineus longissimus TaxID=88925 RepID=UPI002B4F4752
MASGGYGRGGRGAALLQALSQPVRRPGEEKENTPTTTSPPASSTPVPTTTPAPMGRGLALGRGAYMSSLLEAAKKTSSDSATGSVASRPGSTPRVTAPAPAGRGVAALGRGVAAISLGGRGIASMGTPATMSPAHSEAASSNKPPSPKGGGQGFSDNVNVINVAGKPAMVFKGTSGKPVHLGANSIHIKSGNAAIYQYAIHFHPQVDSRNMRYRLINEQRATIGPVKAFDGCILFLPKQLEHKQITIQSKKPTDGSPVAITITLTKMLSPGAEECMQVYNVIFRRMMACLKLVQINRNHYYPGGAVQVPQHKLEIWPGYCTAIAEQEGGLMLLTDVSHRVLRTLTVLDVMCDIQKKNRNFRDNVIKAVQGCTVLTRYNNKTYRIDDIAWDQNPKCSFLSSATGESMTYQEYYLKNYNKKIFDDEQPLLIHRPKVSKQEQQKREPREGRPRAEVICLVPELCYLTGLTDEMRDDFRVMKDLAVHTRINPNQRNRSLREFIRNVKQNEDASKQLEDWGLQLDTDTLNLDGRQLPPEDIFWRGGQTQGTVQADWGRDLNRQKVISAVDIVNWMVLSTQRDSPKANDFIKMMKQIGPSIGINIRDPHQIHLKDDRVDTYLRSIKENLNNTVQCVVTIFPTKRDDRYSAVKKLCCVEQPVPSQAINARTISDKNKLKSVVMKIALQINCKLGGELWAVEMPTKNMMVIGIDVYHEGKGGKGKSVGGFVASTNPELTRWYSRVCIQLPHQELIDGLKSCITAALKKYHEINHDLPGRIMIFRDGVGDGQLARVADYEVQQITECFRHFGDYHPKLGVVVVQKRINTRIWSVMNRDLENPPPGTIVDHTITRRDWYDFFLISQHVRQGTVSPTHYVVVHDSSGLSPNQIQRLAYKLTHLYYNWPGTVRVPAPCQYAHKLAYLIGQNTHKEHSLELSDRLFFL